MGTPTLDGTGTSTHSITDPGAFTVALTTAQPNDIICLLTYSGAGRAATGSPPPPLVASITGGGLTFAQQVQSTGSFYGIAELWWALAPTALIATPFTITFAAGPNYDGAGVVAFGVHGCNLIAPWTNFTAVSLFGDGVTPSFSGINPPANTLMIFAATTNQPWTGGTLPTGFSSVGSMSNITGYASASVAARPTPTGETGQVYSWGSPIPSHYGGQTIIAGLAGAIPVPVTPPKRIYDTSIAGVGKVVQFGGGVSGSIVGGGPKLMAVDGGQFSMVAADGTTAVRLSVADPVNGGDAVTLNALRSVAAPLPLGFFIPGRPPSSQVYNLVMGIAVTVPANFAGSVVYASTVTNLNAVFILNKISGGVRTAVGGMTLTAGSQTVAVFSTQAVFSLAAGDVLQLVAPASQDLSLSDIGITILAMKV